VHSLQANGWVTNTPAIFEEKPVSCAQVDSMSPTVRVVVIGSLHSADVGKGELVNLPDMLVALQGLTGQQVIQVVYLDEEVTESHLSSVLCPFHIIVSPSFSQLDRVVHYASPSVTIIEVRHPELGSDRGGASNGSNLFYQVVSEGNDSVQGRNNSIDTRPAYEGNVWVHMDNFKAAVDKALTHLRSAKYII